MLSPIKLKPLFFGGFGDYGTQKRIPKRMLAILFSFYFLFFFFIVIEISSEKGVCWPLVTIATSVGECEDQSHECTVI